MELIQQLVGNLGIREDQATGGAGLLFNFAKDRLGSGEFQQILDKVPGISDLMTAAPERSAAGGGLMGAIGGVASALSGQAGGLGTVASLAGGFSQLGLDSSMIGKFVPIVLSFAQNQGGDTTKELLEKVLKIS